MDNTPKPTDIHEALSNASRFLIVELLIKHKLLGVSIINDKLGICPTLTSHHFRKLKNLGIIESIRSGKRISYKLAKGVRSGKGIKLNKMKVSWL